MKFRISSVLTVIVIAVLLAYGVISLMNIRAEVTAADKTKAQLQTEIEQMQEENAALQYAIDNQEDPATIEDIARDKLGLVMPDEQIFYDAGE